ncbi:MAG: DUF4129 domain-containing protein [Gemmatimonadales bacterium]
MALDSLRQVVADVFTRPDYQWVERRRPLLWLANLWSRFLDWINRLAEDNPLGFDLLFAAAVVVLVLLLVHIGYVVWKVLRPRVEAGRAAAGGTAAILDASAHLARAEALARAGRYAEALGHRFLALVLTLERADVVRFHASKTPAEYVAEARLDDDGRSTLSGLVARLYRYLFGAAPCGEAEYQAFGAAARALEAPGGRVAPA